MFKRKYKVSYERLNGNKATVTQLLSMAQETTIAKTNETSRNVQWYLDNMQGWIFLNWNVEILQYPKYEEEVVCTTVPVKFKRFLGQRDFRIENLNGEVIMNASIKTALIDLVTKQPLEPTKELLAEYGEQHEEFITNKFKLPKPTEENGFSCISTNEVIVKRLDTDTNLHTNNLKYIEWAENEIPEEIYRKLVKKVQVVFKQETLRGDILKIETYVNNKNNMENQVYVCFKKDDEIRCEVMFTC